MKAARFTQMATLALLASLGGAATASAQSKTFTISWWGYNGEKMNANIIEPFKKICDCNIVFETGNNADRLNKLKLRDGKGVDVVYLSDSFSQQGIEQGMFKEIDPSKIPNLAEIYELGRAPQGKYGPAYTIGRVGLVYDSAKVNPPVTSWNDLWRPDLKSAVSLPGITTTAGPMAVIQAGKHAGVDPYADTEKTFAAVEALKPNIVKNYNTGSELVNLISTGEVRVAMAQDFTLASMQAAVKTMTWAKLKEGDIATVNTINISKGTENLDLAYKFIDFILSKDVQQKEAEQGVDAPINTKVVLTPEQAKIWTYGAEQVGSLSLISYSKMNAAKTEWIDQWNEVFGK
ncbi:ABC transporter substrate-binding protein [Rhizobium sp. XQZ8]|uniref:ABC transporter substrate-binding protein n=1 Tax=Rhizobium populisoli TaxID=2859785 RepID=UPI001C68664D|nr:ABC transporter substrate-binding protein [Rhizobium populisoli]MBW6420683.1 ABC transporter substrate-binding protein [Rhizobium populisoli]